MVVDGRRLRVGGAEKPAAIFRPRPFAAWIIDRGRTQVVAADQFGFQRIARDRRGGAFFGRPVGAFRRREPHRDRDAYRCDSADYEDPTRLWLLEPVGEQSRPAQRPAQRTWDLVTSVGW